MDRPQTARLTVILNTRKSHLKTRFQGADRTALGIVTEGVFRSEMESIFGHDCPEIVLSECMRRFGNGGGTIRWIEAVNALTIGLSGQVVLKSEEINPNRPTTAALMRPTSGFLRNPKQEQYRPDTSITFGNEVRPNLNNNSGNDNNIVFINNERPSTAALLMMQKSGQMGNSNNNSNNRPMTGARPSTGARPMTGAVRASESDNARYDAIWNSCRAVDIQDSEFVHVENLKQIIEQVYQPYHSSASLRNNVASENDIAKLIARCDIKFDKVCYTQFLSELISLEFSIKAQRAQTNMGQGNSGAGAPKTPYSQFDDDTQLVPYSLVPNNILSKDQYVEVSKLIMHPKFKTHLQLLTQLKRHERDLIKNMQNKLKAPHEGGAAADEEHFKPAGASQFAFQLGRLPKHLVVAELAKPIYAMLSSKISRMTLNNMLHQCSFQLNNENINYYLFVLKLIQVFKNMNHLSSHDPNAAGIPRPGTAAITEHQAALESPRSVATPYTEATNAMHLPPDQLDKLSKLKQYLRLIVAGTDVNRDMLEEERRRKMHGGAGGAVPAPADIKRMQLKYITELQFEQLLTLLRIHPEYVQFLMRKYLNKYNARIDLFKFMSDLENGRITLIDEREEWSAPAGSPRAQHNNNYNNNMTGPVPPATSASAAGSLGARKTRMLNPIAASVPSHVGGDDGFGLAINGAPTPAIQLVGGGAPTINNAGGTMSPRRSGGGRNYFEVVKQIRNTHNRTPDLPGSFDDQALTPPPMHDYAQKNPLLQKKPAVGSNRKQFPNLPRNLQSVSTSYTGASSANLSALEDITFGFEYPKGAESIDAILSHGYLKGHIEKVHNQRMAEKSARSQEARRFHTRKSLAVMNHASRLGEVPDRVAVDNFKMSRFTKVKARTDSGLP